MIVGRVSARGVPLIELPVGGKTWIAVIDTGFNGHLELPNELRRELRVDYWNDVEVALAEGIQFTEPHYLLKSPFHDRDMHAIVTFSSRSASCWEGRCCGDIVWRSTSTRARCGSSGYERCIPALGSRSEAVSR